jgi:ATP-dependent exoDNAse (exonuclease V) alpha subunit
VLDMVDGRDDRGILWALVDQDTDTSALSEDQRCTVTDIAHSPWLVQPLSAPAGAGKTTSMRALRAAAHRCRRRVLVLAPTGQAVDVALREGAGDEGYTIAKALHMLRNDELHLKPGTMVIVDEAGMVGTDDLRRLLSATTQARVKTVLVGDAHQLAPVKARGGMFEQLCTDLPWAQHLSEVWRIHDPAERTASLALRDGDATALRRAVRWYQREDRLLCGDQISMASEALTAYRADAAAGKDALLVCDTNEMADALNQRLHRHFISADADTVAVSRGQRVAVGDLILTRRNDPTIDLYQTADAKEKNPPIVRNGNRWHVIAVDPAHHRLAARRLGDHVVAAISGDYLTEYVTLGYATTVHAAQGVTADTTHAVLGDTASRNLLYVAMSRGRARNTAYLYQRPTEQEYGPSDAAASWRGDAADARQQLTEFITGTLERPHTAHDVAARSATSALPTYVQHVTERRSAAVLRRQGEHRAWRQTVRMAAAERVTDRARDASRGRSVDEGLRL